MFFYFDNITLSVIFCFLDNLFMVECSFKNSSRKSGSYYTWADIFSNSLWIFYFSASICLVSIIHWKDWTIFNKSFFMPFKATFKCFATYCNYLALMFNFCWGVRLIAVPIFSISAILVILWYFYKVSDGFFISVWWCYVFNADLILPNDYIWNTFLLKLFSLELYFFILHLEEEIDLKAL